MARRPGNDPQDRNNSFTGFDPRDIAGGNVYTRLGGGGMMVMAGRIIEGVPFTRQYTVAVPGSTHITCGHGFPGDVNCLQTGTSVIVAIYPGGGTGTIIGIEPSIDGGGPMSPLHGSILLGGGACGISSPMFDAYKNQSTVGGLMPRVDHAPTDGVPGDDGMLSPLDVGVIVSFGMAMLRATDTAAVEVYGFDSLLRLQAYNYERFSAGYERRQLNDEGELHDVEFGAKFPWEGDGVTTPGGAAFKQSEGVQWTDPFAAVEPTYPDQTGAWRIQTLRGYLGDMFRQQILRQPDTRAATPARYGEPGGPVAVSDVRYGADGSIHLRSAKEILLQKYVFLPAAEQLALPDDPVDGDGPDNYLASGMMGSGSEADSTTSSVVAAYDGGEAVANKRMAALSEYIAYVTNYAGPANLVAHEKDWSYPEEGAESAGWTCERTVIAGEKLNELCGKYWAGLPEERVIDVDARLPGVKYYDSSATVMITDDGGIVLEDAWGSSIQMCRGNIVISCPGDILMNPGRRLVAQAGYDAIVRARNSVDITTTEGDVRIKADRNFHVLSGNAQEDGTGGILLESRAAKVAHDYSKQGEGTVSTGITLLARNSQVAAIGSDVYLGASGTDSGGGGDGGDGVPPAIVIDASRTERPVYVAAGQVLRRATQFIDKYGEEDAFASATKDLWFTQAKNLVVGGNIMAAEKDGGGGNLLVEKALVVKGSALFDKSLVVRDTIATAGQMYAGRGVGKSGATSMVAGTEDEAGEEFLDKLKVALDNVDESFTEALDTIDAVADDAREREEKIDEVVRSDEHFGGAKLMNELMFTLRTTADYAAADFSLFEPSWLAHEDIETETWEEKPVEGPSDESWPFPGMERYQEPGALLTAARKLFSFGEGRAAERGKAAERGGVYAEKPEEPEEKTLNEMRVMRVRKEESQK